MHLPTGHVITRGRVVSLPITPNVIDLVHKMAVLDGMPTNLKIEQNRSDDAAWTAGVDYDPQSQEDIEDRAEAEEDLDEEYDEVDPNEVQDINENIVNPSDADNNVAEQEGVEIEEEPADDLLIPVNSIEELSESEDDEATEDEEPNEIHHITRAGRVSRPATRFADASQFSYDASNQ